MTRSASSKAARKPAARKRAAAPKKKAAAGRRRPRLSSAELDRRALAYHEKPRPGKIEISITKPVKGPDDLTLAYSPGVAAPCLKIHQDASNAYRYTGKGNLVGIVTNGSAVLGLGNIGPLAAKPVMEGKAMLFKKFAGIDVFDIEVSTESPERFIECVAAISHGFGAINLEDIAAPECFLIEERLSEQLDIPVMHDDQTGTGVVACAALANALEIQGKRAEDVRIVCVGAGAAGIGVLRMITNYFSISPYQVTLIDSRGLVTCDRTSIPNFKMPFARQPISDFSDQLDIYRGADVLIGVSGAGTVSADAVRVMAANPIVLALSNPNPEIGPEEVAAVRSDAIVGTGRSDYPNQVNNSLCYPYMFRGALDARAKKFTRQMYAAAIKSIADLAREPVPARIRRLYPQEKMTFGRGYIMPKQDDERMLERVSAAVSGAYEPEVAEPRRKVK